LRADRFAHQHGARGPFAAEAETEQCTGNDQLIEILHKGADQREEREPQDGQLQGFDAADAIREIAAQPAADRGGQQRHRSGKSGAAGVDFPHRDDGADHERIDHEIHTVERPARRASPERPPFRQVHVAIKGEEAGVLDGRDFHGA
jgi:hypothetical protein